VDFFNLGFSKDPNQGNEVVLKPASFFFDDQQNVEFSDEFLTKQ